MWCYSWGNGYFLDIYQKALEPLFFKWSKVLDYKTCSPDTTIRVGHPTQLKKAKFRVDEKKFKMGASDEQVDICWVYV